MLLANEHGYPLRWKVVPGKSKDHQAMGEMLEELRDISWLEATPVVLDRAMGRESTLHKLLKSGLHFLTAAPVNSIESHTTTLPYEPFTEFAPDGTDENYQKDIMLAARIARDAGYGW